MFHSGGDELAVILSQVSYNFKVTNVHPICWGCLPAKACLWLIPVYNGGVGKCRNWQTSVI